MSQLMTPEEAAARLRVNTMTVYRLIRAGDLPAFRVGRQYRLTADDVEAYVTRQRVAS